ncbi:hypothetical protein JHK85_008483 [Glycine max]|nr:hypothetical protein JHK85_008483 [Glycine max]
MDGQKWVDKRTSISETLLGEQSSGVRLVRKATKIGWHSTKRDFRWMLLNLVYVRSNVWFLVEMGESWWVTTVFVTMVGGDDGAYVVE